MNSFYVYRHIRLDTNTPFYVGKGRSYRASFKNKRSQYWQNIANKYGYKIEYIVENLSENEAFAKEIEFISLYKSLGYCEANFTDGGEGPSGFKHSKETKKKMSKAQKIAQNKPELKAKLSSIKKKLFNKPEWTDKQSKVSKKMWQDPKFKEKTSKAIKKALNKPEWTDKQSKISKKTWDARLKKNTFNVYRAIKIKKGNYKKGEFIGSWYNQSTCARDLLTYQSNIQACLSGKRNIHKGYIFEYCEKSNV
jgi:hypothetical protein